MCGTLIFSIALMYANSLVPPAEASEYSPKYFGGHWRAERDQWREKFRGDFAKLGRVPDWIAVAKQDANAAVYASVPKSCADLVKMFEEKKSMLSKLGKFEEIEGTWVAADCFSMQVLSESEEASGTDAIGGTTPKNLAPTIADFGDSKRVPHSAYAFLSLKKPQFLRVEVSAVGSVTYREDYRKDAKDIPAGRSSVIFHALARAYPPKEMPYLLVLKEWSGAGSSYSECSLLWINYEKDSHLKVSRELTLGRCG